MTTTQAIGVALILLGVAYAIVWVGWLRRRPTEPAASAPSGHRSTEDADAVEPEPAASAPSGHRTTEDADAVEPEPAASASPGHRTTDDADAPQEEPAASAPPGHRTTDGADAPEDEEAVDVTQGVAGRYLGTTSPDGEVAKDLTRAADATLTVAYGALAWRPTKGTALRAESAELVAVDGLDAGRSGADTPLTVRWHPPAAPGTTYETRFVPGTPGARAALADAVRALRPDLFTAATTAASSSDPATEETA